MEKKCASLVHILARRELGDRTPFSAGGVWCSTHQKNSSAQLSLYYNNHIRGECERGEILTFDRTPRSVPENPVGDECGYVIDKRMNFPLIADFFPPSPRLPQRSWVRTRVYSLLSSFL
ncbi:hypothetical protein PUN28_020746 [Cardiocondyla obscurior]|uniref:Uncharacterized protein n=1 Tax=Cardiocondyla obscurior TaxID=286306 RepID=A0AAW2E552_9HYME